MTKKRIDNMLNDDSLTSLGVKTYALAPGVLSIRTNHISMYDLVYGNLPAWGEQPSNVESDVCVDYLMVRDVRDFYPEFAAASEEYGSNLVFMRRKLVGRIETQMVLDWTEHENPVLITNKAYDWWSRIRGTNAHPTAGWLLSQMVSAQLVLKDYAGIHCAALEKDGKAVLLVAASDTGKTTTSWNLTQKYGFKFICEDIGITDGKNVYGCPYTSTGLPRGVKSRRPGLIQTLAGKLIKNSYKPSLMSMLNHSQVIEQATVSAIVFLQRGEGGVTEFGVEDAQSLFYRLHRLEFRYQADNFLLQSWNRRGEPDLDLVSRREREILNTLVSSADDNYLIRASDPDEFADHVQRLI